MIEYLIVAVIVLWSAIVVFKKVFPNTSSSVFLKLSNAAAAKGWLRLAKWLKPTMAAGCGGNCACPATDEAENKKPDVQAVKWK